MEQPKFIRDFSKQESADERNQLAQEVREKRKNYFDEKGSLEAREQEKGGLTEEIKELSKRMELYKDASFFVKIKDFFAIKKIEGEFKSKQNQKKSIEEELAKSIEGRQDLDETRDMIADFYAREKKKWEESPYSKKDIAEYFTEENLTSLSLEEYALLLRRFPGQMISHVTRQGIRDHITMFEHRKGMEEMHNGFKDMLESKRLRSPLAVAMSQARSCHDICQFLNRGEEITTARDSIKENTEPTPLRPLIARLKNITNGKKEFNDKTAVHFAVGEVANSLYGGENGNEIFICFPSAFVASKYYFKNFENDVVNTPDPSNHNHNDLYVWAKNEEDGMNINAAVVFIPEDAKVDPKTGSQYEIDISGKPIKEGEALKRTENAMNSRDYWENYFAQHPGTRPSKIVYYDSNMSPTKALLDWKIKNGIIDKKAAPALGFDENAIDNNFNRPGAEESMVEFHRLALTALAEEYGIADVVHTYDKDYFTSPEEERQERIDRIYKKSAT